MPRALLNTELFNPNKVMQGRVELGPSSHHGTGAFCPFHAPNVPFQGCASRGSLADGETPISGTQRAVSTCSSQMQQGLQDSHAVNPAAYTVDYFMSSQRALLL